MCAVKFILGYSYKTGKLNMNEYVEFSHFKIIYSDKNKKPARSGGFQYSSLNT